MLNDRPVNPREEGMKIRQANQEDALELSSLCRDVQRLHAEAHPELFKNPEREDFAEGYFSEVLVEPGITIYIAEEDGSAVGYVFCRFIERPENPFNFAVCRLSVDQISVRPAAQGGGIGAALMGQARNLAKELGVEKIQLDSWDFNSPAHGFFESLGFRKFNFRFWQDV
jgi:ribosomal protein S18 acetylase RimI-like enzyme